MCKSILVESLFIRICSDVNYFLKNEQIQIAAFIKGESFEKITSKQIGNQILR